MTEASVAPERGGEPLRPWPEAVLFDLDGTLADSFAAITTALDGALREEGLRGVERRWVERHVGRGAEALVRDAAGEAPSRTVSAVGRRFARHYAEIFLEQTPPMPGAAEVVAAIALRTGGRVGVVSNKAAALCRSWLEHWGFARHVAAVSGPDTSGARKPDPAAVRPVLEAMGVAPARALMVGDMTVDVQVGRTVGMPAVAIVGVTSTRRELEAAGAEAILEDIRALPTWLAAHVKIPVNEEEA
jgi:phosphoglycolate phosphatase